MKALIFASVLASLIGSAAVAQDAAAPKPTKAQMAKAKKICRKQGKTKKSPDWNDCVSKNIK